jgi:two-component system, response regulator YesN
MTNTIKVIIVDDERLERNLIKNCIDWKYFNMEIIGEASTVNEALLLLESNTPDIVITDINMPVIDGMQFIGIASRKYPHIKFVVLTGFDNFSYAQKSIKLRVSDFLLKPINDEDVFKTASNLKVIIEQEREAQEEYYQLRKQLYDNLPYLKERFLHELLKGRIGDKTIEERLSFLGIQFKYKSFQVAVLEINHLKNEDEEFRYMQNIKVMNLVKSNLTDNKYVQIFFDSDDRIIILNNDENSDLFEKCELLKDYITRELNCYVGIGLGSLKKELHEICFSYREALDALDYRVAIDKNTVILYNHIDINNKETKTNTAELYNKLCLYLKSGLRSKAKEVIEVLFDSIDLKCASAVRQIRVVALEILMICLRNSMDTKLDAENPHKSKTLSFNQIFAMDTIPEIKEHLFSVVENTTQTIDRQQIDKMNTLIKNIKRYVDQYYIRQDLTLSNVAKEFFLNPSYLSRTFKKEAGIGFIEYLTNVRMEKAISLLSGKEDMKVFEIADAVGIPDPNYFSTCFKKYTGISVSDYRKSSSININCSSAS